MTVSKSLWAKIPLNMDEGSFLWLSIYQHALDSMFVSERLFDGFLSSRQRRELASAFSDNVELARKFVKFMCGVHDNGKISPLFELGSRINAEQRHFVIKNMENTGLLSDSLLDTGYERQVVRHCFSGAFFLQQWMKETKGIKSSVSKKLTACVNGHHGEWRNIGSATRDVLEEEYISGNKAWDCARYEFFENISDLCGLSEHDWDEISLLPLNTSIQMLLTGIVIMSDWISSNTDFFPLLKKGNVADSVGEKERVDIGMERLSLPDTYDFKQPPNPDTVLGERFNIQHGKLNDMQSMVFSISQELSNHHEPALVIIQEEMGKGKTEASLIAAENMSPGESNGVLFALPTQATTNAMLSRFTGWISTLSPNLGFAMQHSSAKTNKEYDAMRYRSFLDSNESELPHINTWFEGSRKGVLAPFTLCTIDQVLMMALNCKFVALKHLGIGTKTIIVDEVHSSDLYMTCFLDKALEWLAACGVSVIMLSATLSKEQCMEMLSAYNRGANVHSASSVSEAPLDITKMIASLSYPSISVATGQGIDTYAIVRTDEPKTYRIRMCPGYSEDEIAEDLCSKIADGGVAGIVCNTVNSAQSIYEKVMFRRQDDVEVLLLHSRYTSADRQKIESLLVDKLGKNHVLGTGRPEKAIIIGTQVIEQSLDIDLDYMVSYLAPVDLIFQRIGREHRHSVHDADRKPSLSVPEVSIVGYDVKDGRVSIDKGSTYVYDKALLLKTLAVLSEHDGDEIRIPNDIEPMMDIVYEHDSRPKPVGDPMKWVRDLEEALDAYNRNEREQRLQASRFILGSPDDASDLIALTCAEETQKDDDAASGVRLGIGSVQAVCLKVDDDNIVKFVSSSNDAPPAKAGDFEVRDIIDNTAPLPASVSGAYGEIDEYFGMRQDELLDNVSSEQIAKYGLQSIANSSYAYGKKVLVFPNDGMLRIGKYLVGYDSKTGITVVKD